MDDKDVISSLIFLCLLWIQPNLFFCLFCCVTVSPELFVVSNHWTWPSPTAKHRSPTTLRPNTSWWSSGQLSFPSRFGISLLYVVSIFLKRIRHLHVVSYSWFILFTAVLLLISPVTSLHCLFFTVVNLSFVDTFGSSPICTAELESTRVLATDIHLRTSSDWIVDVLILWHPLVLWSQPV